MSRSSNVAKVFWSGPSQAVRLPKPYRLDVDEVLIRREGGQLVLVPRREKRDRNGWPAHFWDIFGEVGKDFDLGERHPTHERHALLDG